MLTRLICIFSLVSILALALPAAAQDQTLPTTAPEPAPHPRIWISSKDLPRLRALARQRSYDWRRLINWAEEPARRKTRPQDGPGLALAALILSQDQPVQARRLGKLAVACALQAAPLGRVQTAGKRKLRYQGVALSGAELWEAGFRLVVPNAAQARVLAVERFDNGGLLVKGGQPAPAKLSRKGDTCLFLLGELAAANQRLGWAAVTLDWAWPYFEPGQRRHLAAWLVAQARVFSQRGHGCFDADSLAALRLTALAGLAALGQHPGASALVRQALEQRFEQEILPCLRGAGQGGAWFGGEAAGARAGLDLLEFAAAVKSALGRDLSQSASWFGDRLGFLAAALLPGINYTTRGAFYRLAPLGDQMLGQEEIADLVRLQMLILLALRPQDQAAGLARALISGTRGTRLLAPHRLALELVWQGPDANEEALAFAPLTFVAPAAGLAFSRSDWSPLATWLAFSCGPHYALPQHLAAGSLTIWRREFILPQAGGYDGPTTAHALNYAVRSVAHNTVLILDPREYSWPDMRQGVKPRGTYANDGGQRSWTLFGKDGKPLRTAPWTASGWEQGPAPWSKLREVYEVARITAQAEMPRYFYLRGDMTRAYQGSTAKASRVVRHVFHLRAGGPQDYAASEVIAVVDDVVLRRKDLAVRFALHFPGKPDLPSGLEPLGPGRLRGPLRWLSYTGKRSRLEVRCLWPRNSRAWIFGGDKAGSWVNGKNYPPRSPVRNPAPWRVEIGAEKAAGLNRPLVHVLLPADREAPPPPDITLLAADQPEVKGLVVHDPRWPRVVAVRLGEPDPRAALSYACPPGRSRHLVAGLAPGVSYRVVVGGTRVSLKPGPGLKASPAGTLSFLVEPTGGKAP